MSWAGEWFYVRGSHTYVVRSNMHTFLFSFKLFWGVEVETRSRVAQDSIELSLLPRMTLNWYSCFHLPSAEITGTPNHALCHFFLLFIFSVKISSFCSTRQNTREKKKVSVFSIQRSFLWQSFRAPRRAHQKSWTSRERSRQAERSNLAQAMRNSRWKRTSP